MADAPRSRRSWPLAAGALLLVVAGVAMAHHLSRPAPETVIALKPARAAAPRPVLPVATPPAPVDERFVLKSVLPIETPFRHGDHVWDESSAPAGPIVITVDLDAQVLSVFRDGHEIGAAVILYGADEKPTPLGTFAISQKDADHVSNLYGAPMPYMLRLTNDGISIHGSDVVHGRATHGCVGVPTPFARKLFATVRVGDRVIVTNGKRISVGDAIAPPA